MNTYHKIQTVFLRDPATKYKTLLMGKFSRPEFDYLKNNKWCFTEKVDGTNIRVMYKNDKLLFAGKTDRAQLYPKLLEKLKELFLPNLNTFQDIFKGKDVCLYGEGYGEKIQSGGKYCKGQNFVLFDVKVDNVYYLQRHDTEDIANKLGIDVVPVIGYGTLFNMVQMVEEGFKSIWGNFTAEGIVAKPTADLYTRERERIITKLKYKDFAR